jgi:hypothetical protein
MVRLEMVGLAGGNVEAGKEDVDGNRQTRPPA